MLPEIRYSAVQLLAREMLTRILRETVTREEIAMPFPGFLASHALTRSRRKYRTFSADGSDIASVVSPAMDVDDSYDDDDVDTGDFEDVEAEEDDETDE